MTQTETAAKDIVAQAPGLVVVAPGRQSGVAR